MSENKVKRNNHIRIALSDEQLEGIVGGNTGFVLTDPYGAEIPTKPKMPVETDGNYRYINPFASKEKPKTSVPPLQNPMLCENMVKRCYTGTVWDVINGN